MRSRLSPVFYILLLLCVGHSVCCSGGNGGSPGPGALQVLTTSLPGATAGVSYVATLMATGGTPPYTWSLVSAGLPPGLSLASATGEISGTPTQTGQFNFTVRVADAGGQSAQRALTIQVATSAPTSVTFTINPATTHQTWRGLRATAFGVISGDSNPPCTETGAALRGQAWDDLVNDLGLTGLRLHFGPGGPNPTEHNQNDNSDPFVRDQAFFNAGLDAQQTNFGGNCLALIKEFIIAKQVNEIRQRVINRGETFSLYISSDYRTLVDMPAWWQSSSSEGAEFLEAYWVWFRDRFGYYPSFFTVNEPDGTYYSSGYMGRYMKEVGDRFQIIGATTSRIQLPEEITASGSNNRIPTLNNTSGLMAYIEIFSYHGYDYNNASYPSATGLQDRNNVRAQAITFGKDTGMTEICCKTNWDGRYGHGLDLLRDLYMNAIEGRISYWEPLSVIGICSDNSCNVGAGSVNNFINFSNDLSTYYLQPVYWIMRQFSKYVRPGYLRVETTCSGCTQTVDRGPDVKAMTWKNPATGKFVVVLINESGSQKTVAVAGLPSGNYTLHQLELSMCSTFGGKNRCTPQSQQVSATTNLAMPADGVWTLVQQ